MQHTLHGGAAEHVKLGNIGVPAVMIHAYDVCQ